MANKNSEKEDNEKESKVENGENHSNDKTGGNEKPRTPALEWIMAIIGLILVTGSVGFLTFKAIATKEAPPKIVFRQSEIIKIETAYLVKFTIENSGGDDAANIIVEGKLMQNEEDVETSSVTVDYVPTNSTRDGGLYFSKNPKDYNFQIRALGYAKP